MRISDKRMEMLFVPLNLCFPAIFIQSVLLLSMAGFMWYITIVNGYFRSSLGKMIQCPVTARLIVWRHHPCQWLHLILSVKMINAPCHDTAIHLSVLDHAGIGFTILLRLSLTPHNREFGARHSHPISLTPFHGWLYARASPLSVATSPPLVKMVQDALSRHG